MDNFGKLATAVIGSTKTNNVRVLKAVFVSTEVEDVHLSKVTLAGGSTARWVPKWKSVGTMTVGDLLWLISDGNSYVIAGVEQGNRNLADTGM